MADIAGLWFALLAGFFAILLGLGRSITKYWLGFLVDSRNRLSLSRLQVIAWTWLLVSSLFAVALAKRTMDIFLEPELWALMGISLGSAAGAVIVKGTKTSQVPDESRLPSTAQSAQAPAQGQPNRQAQERHGVLVAYDRPSFADLFKGEEVTDAPYVDISKVQMFFFTVAAFGGYAWALWHWTIGAPAEGCQGAVCFPPISQSLVVLLGISHAGYLTVKASPKTPTQ